MAVKIILLFFLLIVFFLSGCATEGVACPEDARLCSDGTSVVRVGPDCEFEACPSQECDYEENDIRKYVMKDPEECDTVMFLCVPRRTPFFDECGCGCELAEEQ